MIGNSPDWGGVLGAILKVAQTPDPSQNGLQALNNFTANHLPITPKGIGNFFAHLLTYMGPGAEKFLLAVTALILAYLSRDLIKEVAGFIVRLILGLPDHEPMAFMQLTFPADTEKSAFATSRLYSLLEAGPEDLNWLEQLAAVPKRYSLELVASHNDGIRYILAVPESEAESIHANLLSYMPGLKIRETTDYVTGLTGSKVRIAESRFTGDPILPLRDQGDQDLHDPIDFIAGHMTALGPDDLIAYQIVLSPISRVTHPRVESRRDQILSSLSRNVAITPLLKKPIADNLVWARILLWLIEHTIGLLLAIFAKVLLGTPSPFAPSVEKPEYFPVLTKREEELSDQVFLKLNDSLFAGSIRVLVTAADRKTTRGRMNSVLTSFRLFATRDQSLVAPRQKPKAIGERKLSETPFAERKLSKVHPMPQVLLGLRELADLYHFPNTALNNAPLFLKSRNSELPMPTAFRNAMSSSDSLYGANYHGGTELPIRIPRDQRQTHTYVFGRTGSGKTTLLTRAIAEDMENYGVAVLDPHGDLFHYLPGIVPGHRQDKVVIFNPADRANPVGINILNPGIKFASVDEAHDRITSAVIAVFEKMTEERYWGPRMEDILRHATLTALKTKNPNLFTLQRLLTDQEFMLETAASLEDPVLRQFWEEQMAHTGDWQLTKFTSPITSRLGHFITSELSRHILLQQETTISVEEVMDQGKILLVNLSKGEIGEDQSSFFGSIVTSLIWMATLARAGSEPYRRPTFYLYVDEFQNFATRNFSEIVSEGRKFGIALTLAHQSVAQIPDPKVLEVIAGNAGTMISFAGSPNDEKFLQPFMAPIVRPGDIVGLPPHHFYILAKDIPEADVFTGVTAPMEWMPRTYSADTAAAVTLWSQHKYGTSKSVVDRYLDAVFADVDRGNKLRRRKYIKKLKRRTKKAAKAEAAVVKAAQKPTQPQPGYGFSHLGKLSSPARTQNNAHSRSK